MKFSVWFCLFAAMTLAACQRVQTTEGGVVGIERRQSMSSLISASQVDRSAALAYGKVISEAGKKNQLNRDSAQVERVRGVANRLIPSTAAFRADAPRWNWEVNVITSPEVNAWCMPGGKIAVYSGLLTKLDPTDEELAAVMGHEIAHALREHGRERASEQVAQQLGVSVLSVALGLGDLGAQHADPELLGHLLEGQRAQRGARAGGSGRSADANPARCDALAAAFTHARDR